MRIVVTVEDPDPGFLDKFTALLAEHGAQVELDTEWTMERATRYYSELPPRAQDIVRLAAVQDGLVKAEELRTDGEGSLRGHSGALKRTLERGVRQGWWPDGMKPPIEAQGPGFGKVKGYLMPLELVDVFSAAAENVEKSGRTLARDIVAATDAVHRLADTLTAKPTREQHATDN